MICAAIPVFQDAKSLKRCLDSLADFDLVLVVDGVYEGYPAESPLSTDGTRELCTQYDNAKLIDAPNLKEFEKRNVYLKACPWKHLLVIDSDEWLEGDIRGWMKQVEQLTGPGIYNIDTKNSEGSHSPAPRIIINPQEFEYYGAHCVVKQGNRIFRLRGEYSNLIGGVTICMNDDLRTVEYERAWQKYRQVQIPLERPFKDRY